MSVNGVNAGWIGGITLPDAIVESLGCGDDFCHVTGQEKAILHQTFGGVPDLGDVVRT